jgi:uncharacterized protein
MEQPKSEIVIQQTKNWIEQVVMTHNFCPYAAKEFNANTIRYIVLNYNSFSDFKKDLLLEFKWLDEHENTATSFLIFPQQFENFSSFIKTISDAENILSRYDYEGVYQIASFHPQYLFEGEDPQAPTHYTNRSPYAMLHLLREDMVEKVIAKFPHSMEKIPDDNIAFTQAKGLEFMKALWLKSFEV